MISKRYLRKYIKRMFNIDVEIDIKHHFWGGYGAIAYEGTETELPLIEIAKSELKDKLPRYIIWHEVGHLFTAVGNGCGVKNEVAAQMWAMREAKKRGYTKVYKELLKYVRDWTDDSEKSCVNDKMYRVAGYIILNKLGAQKVEHYKV